MISRTTFSAGMSGIVMTLVVASVIITVVVVSLYHRHTVWTRRQQTVERLQRAELVWKQRQEQQQHQQQQQQQEQQHPKPKLDGTTHPAAVGGSSSNSRAQELQQQFTELRNELLSEGNKVRGDIANQIHQLLQDWLDQEDLDVRHNVGGGGGGGGGSSNSGTGGPEPRWIRPYLLPPLPTLNGHGVLVDDPVAEGLRRVRKSRFKGSAKDLATFFRVQRIGSSSSSSSSSNRPPTSSDAGAAGGAAVVVADHEEPQQESGHTMTWQDEYDQLLAHHGGSMEQLPGPAVDYTARHLYAYPPLVAQPPLDASYPPLQSLQELMRKWPQDEDYNFHKHAQQQAQQEGILHEALQHFDFSDPRQLIMAQRYRDAELPFKLYNVPELDSASVRWTDDYVSTMFGESGMSSFGSVQYDTEETIPLAKGSAQESRNNYFAFFVAKAWDLESMGLAPTRNNDWSYSTWAQHATYADATILPPDKPHFYWQSGVPPEERRHSRDKWCFISRDLPSFSSPEENFFVFHVKEQKGIQCRFGERGVVAATHFDSGRNMVAMVKGAKRYILSPPNQCSKLGIFKQKRSPIYRHSLLNFGHIQYLDNHSVTGMCREEHAWLERAATSQAVETVLKQGEVLYIPSHWFHYIVSLQKSAQCNVRSGVDMEGTHQFGGRKEVEECKG